MPTRLQHASDLIDSVHNDSWIWTQSMAATPRLLLEGLAARVRERQNLHLMQLHTERLGALASQDLNPHLRHHCFFLGGETRRLVQQGIADYVPMFLSELPLFLDAINKQSTLR